MATHITTAQLCEKLSMSQRAVAELRARRAIPFMRLSKTCIRYDLAEVEKALARRTVKAV